ncbi:WGR domain-containing protein [Paracoccus litorisediminis]|uniref:WGR domain-containing protein n=1 Tax=Paracoccus litorisediminis TaxID=2006130 RepID=UPI0037323AD0
MTAAISEKMFILTDAKNNNNKFWAISIDLDGSVTTRNGRVGSKGQSRTVGNGQRVYDAKIREKERGGYQPVDLVAPVTGAANLDNAAVTSAAEDQIARGNAMIAELVRELARINRHQIHAASGGQMDIDLATGIISTPVGVVTAANLAQARALLQRLEPYVTRMEFDEPGYIKPLQEYLMLVPQKVGSKRGWHRDFITGLDSLTQQGALLDQLEASIEVAEGRIREGMERKGDAQHAPVFDVTMSVNEDPDLRKRIEKIYEDGRKSQHASSRLRMARIFDVSLGSMARDFDADGAKLGGVMELWHGTRAHNLLSILKSGLIIPSSKGSIHVTGRMFGNGVYFSDQSTKSLNYAYGFWDKSAKDNRCFMFLADVAMGKPWHPDRTGASVKPPQGYDSVYARGGKDHVLNNEMIVYRTGQANLKYLVEFEICRRCEK